MGFLSKLFNHGDRKNSQFGVHPSQNGAITVKDTLQPSRPMLTVHPDIQRFLWIGDGENRNYYPSPSNTGIPIRGLNMSLTISVGIDEEPSLIYMALPIADVEGNIERPHYHPTYKDLTPEQRGIYWELLSNPYDNTIDIGYVFILYYGLERYLLTDSYEEVIDIILKLRDAHPNKSFQAYTANAIVLTCLQRKRADIVQKFMNSLDKEHEFSFSPDLYLLCKYSLGVPLSSEEIMMMAKSFEFKKDNYIKKYPDIFQNALLSNINEIYKTDTISWDKVLSASDFKKLAMIEIPIFANLSICTKMIKVPSILSSFMLKKKIYDLLDKSYEDVKEQLAEKRKNGETILEVEILPPKRKEVLTFDTMQEQQLLNAYNSTRVNSLDQHFASISIQDFYYKYRNLDREYLEKCIAYCKDDISKLPEMQRIYIEEEKNKILLRPLLSAEEKQKMISEIRPFFANIPAFKRLAIIYEKEKDYDSAISICDQAILFYEAGGMQSSVLEFSERKQKLLNKKK